MSPGKATKNFFLAPPPIRRRGNRPDFLYPMNVTAAPGSELHEEPYYSIVIPVYNEEDVVGSLLTEVRNFARTWSSDYELLLVDDGSSDRTAEIIGKQFVNWRQGRLIQLSRNCGQAAALFYGMKRARGQVVILLDGDGQNDPQDIPKMLAPLDGTSGLGRPSSHVATGQRSTEPHPGRWRPRQRMRD
jgi:cellulose synthase/poly-beta-1,6-N-acetylglucosamine synthase-like glycosyltransferase